MIYSKLSFGDSPIMRQYCGTIYTMFRRWPLWLYSLANLANSLSYTTVNSYVIFFYIDVLHAPARLIGQAWFAYGIWNTVNDLLLGWLVDRIPAKLGRRAFFILIFSLPVGLAFFLLWSPPAFIIQYGSTALVVYFLILASFYDFCQTAVTISQGALFPQLAIATNDRARLSAFRQVLGIIGLALAFVLSPIIYNSLGWWALGLIWGGVIALLYQLAAIGVHHQTTHQHGLKPNRLTWRLNVRSLFFNHPFLILMLLNFVVRFSVASIQIGMPFYARYTLGLSPTVLSLGLGGILTTAALAVPLWPVIIRWLGPRKTGMVVLAMMVALLIPLLFTTHLGLIIPLALLIGPAFSGVTIVLELLYAQVVDLDLMTVGQSRAGLIGGILGTMLRFSPAVAGLIIGELLTFSHYDPLLTAQPPATQLMLRLIMTLVPAAALGIGLLLLYFYPIHGLRLKTLETKVAKIYQKI